MSHAACDVLGVGTFDEDALYENLDWLAGAQALIEDRLYAQRTKTTPINLFLYDVTSSYFEGTHNELAAFGYNRDGKKGKLQIVIGFLCDEAAIPSLSKCFRGIPKIRKPLLRRSTRSRLGLASKRLPSLATVA